MNVTPSPMTFDRLMMKTNGELFEINGHNVKSGSLWDTVSGRQICLIFSDQHDWLTGIIYFDQDRPGYMLFHEDGTCLGTADWNLVKPATIECTRLLGPSIQTVATGE